MDFSAENGFHKTLMAIHGPCAFVVERAVCALDGLEATTTQRTNSFFRSKDLQEVGTSLGQVIAQMHSASEHSEAASPCVLDDSSSGIGWPQQ